MFDFILYGGALVIFMTAMAPHTPRMTEEETTYHNAKHQAKLSVKRNWSRTVGDYTVTSWTYPKLNNQNHNNIYIRKNGTPLFDSEGNHQGDAQTGYSEYDQLHNQLIKISKQTSVCNSESSQLQAALGQIWNERNKENS